MKILKRSISMLLLFMGLFAVPASANPLKHHVLVGEVVSVKECHNGEMKLLVSGYLNGCDIYKGEVCVTVNKDTKVYKGCEKECKCKDVKFTKGDLVSISLDKKMTKSIPPQAKAERIKLNKISEEKEEKENKDCKDKYRNEEKTNENSEDK